MVKTFGGSLSWNKYLMCDPGVRRVAPVSFTYFITHTAASVAHFLDCIEHGAVGVLLYPGKAEEFHSGPVLVLSCFLGYKS